MAYPASSDFSHLPPTSPLQPCSPSESSVDLSICDINCTPYLRELSLPPEHPSYQHYSDLRTTNKPEHSVHAKLFFHAGSPERSCCKMNTLSIVPSPSTCDECVQECEEGDCELQLTEQCTDQCVVVPCHDTHHAYPPCDPINDACDLSCVNGMGCGALDNFIDCCSDYRHFFPDLRPPNEAPGTFGWPPVAEPMYQGYPDQPASSGSSFYSASSSASTPQLVHSSSTFVSSPSSAAVPSTSSPQYNILHHNPYPPSTGFSCMWGHCTASFSSLNELVGHVNLEHLRLPSTPISSVEYPHVDATSQMHQQLDTSNPLSCLWADCQLYPTPDSIPGPSSGNQTGNVLGILANHLLQDHLGLPTRPPSTGHPSIQHDTTSVQPLHQPPSNSPAPEPAPKSPSASGPLTPAPEHDCSEAQAHVCRWTDCGQSFASCDALTAHITSVHVGSGKAHYDCYWDGCSRHGDNGFASKQKICRHLQSHTGHRPFQCKICRQNFSEAATLAQHMRRHTQEKPYICDFPGCGKSFAITGALTIHKRTHNGHKPFKCSYCDRAFSESSNLSKHLRTHTGARPYPCIESGCNKSFARPDQLARHMTVHRKRDGKITETALPVPIAP